MMNNENIQLTRYLYIKDEVELTFVSAILERSEHALFWAYELYHSGYKKELIQLLWKIYFDFFATLNPSFENYLINKFKQIQNTSCECIGNIIDEKLVGNIVQNLLIRPRNLDVFILRQITSQFEFDCEEDCIKKYMLSKNINDIKDTLFEYLKNDDYLMVSNMIMNIIDLNDITNTFNLIIEYYKSTSIELKINNEKMLNQFIYLIKINDPRIVLLSKLMYFDSLKKNLKMGKNIFIQMESNEIKNYNTLESNLIERKLPPYKIFKQLELLTIDEHNYLSLFSLKRSNIDIKNMWYYHWLYFASFSPMWFNRIKEHNGIINNSTEKVIFMDDDDLEEFFDKYNLEPDEQPIQIQNCFIRTIVKERKWNDLMNKFKNSSVLSIDEDLINDLSNVVY
jgi:hypothetical protein